MFSIIRVNAVESQDDVQITLVSSDGRSANTCVGVDPGQDDRIRLQPCECFVKSRAVKSTVPFLDYDEIRWGHSQLRHDLASLCSFDRDAYSFGFHLSEGISQVRLELLSNPHDGMTEASHTAHQFVDRNHQALSSGSFPALQKITKHVDHDQHRLFHEQNTTRSQFRERLSAAGFGHLPSFFC